MRLVFVPTELTPRHLVALREIPTPLAEQLQETVGQSIDNGQYDEALAAAARVFTGARAARERHAAALALLYQAEALRRLQRWEEALDYTRRALTSLRAEVSQVAAYNKAVALYFEGLIHFVLRADDKALQVFVAAQDALVESERFWGFENNTRRVVDCRNLTRWMSNLLELPSRMPPGELVLIVPVYELVNQTLVRISAMIVTPFQVMLPSEALGEYLPSNYIPLYIETLPFLQLRPDARYLALKIPVDGELIRQSRAGDVLLMEAASPGLPTREVVLSQDAPFVRRTDGRILFGPYEQANEGFVGIPRVLIREKEEEE